MKSSSRHAPHPIPTGLASWRVGTGAPCGGDRGSTAASSPLSIRSYDRFCQFILPFDHNQEPLSGCHQHCLFGQNSQNCWQYGERDEDPDGERCEYSFGRLIDLARAEPVTVAKHGRPVVVVMAVEEFERLKALDRGPSGTADEKDARSNDH